MPQNDFAVYAKWNAIPPTIITAALLGGELGKPYSSVISAASDYSEAAYTYSLESGALPSGLTLNSDGSISGTITKSGSFTFTVKATDNLNGAYDTKQFTVSVSKGTMNVSANGYDNTYDGQPHSITVSAPEGSTIKYSTDNINFSAALPTFKTVGNYTVYYSVTKEDYEDTAGSAHVAISPKTVTVTPNDSQWKYYGTAENAFTYSLSGVASGDTLAFEGALSRDSGESIGTYAYSVDSLKLADNETNENYIMAFGSGKSFEIRAYNPSAQATIQGDKGSNDWYISQAYINAPNGYVISKSNALTGNDWTSYLTVEDGNYSDGQVTYYLKNTETNAISVLKTINIKQDRLAPTGEIKIAENKWTNFLNTITFGLLFKQTQTVEISTQDTVSGITSVQYIKSQATMTLQELQSQTNWISGTSFSVTPDAKFIVYAKIADNAGNTTYLSSDGVIIDASPAVISATPSFAQGQWTVDSTAKIDVSVSDELSGIESVTYRIGTSNPVLSQDSNFSISNLPDGVYSVVITAVDKLGNISTKTIEVKKDTSAPTIAVSGNPTSPVQSTKLSISTQAGASGVKNVTVNGTAVTGTEYAVTQNGTYAFVVTNEAGVTAAQTVTVTNIDTSLPVVSINSNGYVGGTWTNGAIALQVSNLTDNIGTDKLEYKIGDGSWAEFSGDLNITEETNAVYSFRITSESGVTSEVKTISVKIDRSAPTGEVRIAQNKWTSFLNTVTFGTFFKETQKVEISGQDNASGIATIRYIKVPSAVTLAELQTRTDWTSGTDFSVTPDAKFVAYAKIIDNAGNVTYISSDGIVLDGTLPVISGIDNDAVYYGSRKVTISDNNLSTVAVNGKSIDVKDGTASFTLDNNGTEYTIIATDQSGNQLSYRVTVKPVEEFIDQIIKPTVPENPTISDMDTIKNSLSGIQDLMTTEKDNISDSELSALKEQYNQLFGSFKQLVAEKSIEIVVQSDLPKIELSEQTKENPL